MKVQIRYALNKHLEPDEERLANDRILASAEASLDDLLVYMDGS